MTDKTERAPVDRDLEIAAAIEATTKELETAREVVRGLANELADVIEVVEPALHAHTTRLRQARMASVEEMRQVSAGIKALREIVLADSTSQMMQRTERFIALCRDLVELKRTGVFDLLQAFLQTPPPPDDQQESR